MTSMQDFQQTAHGEGHDYAAGQPHIRHWPLRSMITGVLQETVREVVDRRGSCRVLEVGAGHGTFTDHLLAAGASVEVTEMSEPSAAELRRRFRHNPSVTVVDDPDGSAATRGADVDVVACVSVLHHIPDYLSAVDGMIRRVAEGGAFVSFQDPLWYARRSSLSRKAERMLYLSWRLTRGNLLRGLATAGRQMRGAIDESSPSDMVEYHVMRNGVDEVALAALLSGHFGSVDITPYWSSQGDLAQKVGARTMGPNTFGILARNALVP